MLIVIRIIAPHCAYVKCVSGRFVGGCRFEVEGCWLVVTGYWLVVTGCWLVVTGCWLVVTGYWLLVAGYWLAATGSQASWNTKDTKGSEHERHEMGEGHERLADDAGVSVVKGAGGQRSESTLIM